jgi:hypothetical protein
MRSRFWGYLGMALAELNGVIAFWVVGSAIAFRFERFVWECDRILV